MLGQYLCYVGIGYDPIFINTYRGNNGDPYMYYLVYKITNNVNGKIYIGAHKTEDKNDEYMGSGQLIKNAIKKYGRSNFTKEILFEATNAEEMFEKEALLIELGPHSYNLYKSGIGGTGFYNGNATQARLDKLKDEKWREEFGRKISEGLKKKYREDDNFRENITQKNRERGKNCPYHHTEEQKKKIGERMKIINSGENNPNYGKIRITNGIEIKSIEKNEQIPDGWWRGMGGKNNSNMIWITDGNIDKMIKNNVQIPDGWNRGRSTVFHDTMYITNGITNKRVPITYIIPEGWKRGKVIQKNGGMAE